MSCARLLYLKWLRGDWFLDYRLKFKIAATWSRSFRLPQLLMRNTNWRSQKKKGTFSFYTKWVKYSHSFYAVVDALITYRLLSCCKVTVQHIRWKLHQWYKSTVLIGYWLLLSLTKSDLSEIQLIFLSTKRSFYCHFVDCVWISHIV